MLVGEEGEGPPLYSSPLFNPRSNIPLFSARYLIRALPLFVPLAPLAFRTQAGHSFD